MKNVISLKDLEQMVRAGQNLNAIPADAILTPSAREFLQDKEMNSGTASSVAGTSAVAAKISPPTKLLNSKSPKAELEALFNSPYAHSLKEQICAMGRRLWEREYVDGNGGNMAIRVGEDIAICTPTLVSKGSLKPEDMCLVDFEGNQILGTKKTHERNPDALADDEASAKSGRDVSLSSAVFHRVRRRGRSAADLHVAGV